LTKKNLGTFYTPELYAKKSLELLREAIKRVPKGNDYVILDRCAGTGNLEINLTDEELSHTILSTLEYYEYRVLVERLGHKVRHVIPPVETPNTFDKGLVNGADALTQGYVENPIIQQYVENDKCTIIMFENPPYSETTSLEHQRAGKAKTSSVWKQSYVVQEMRKQVSGQTLNDLGNVFIWSAFKYYLRQDTDSYIVYSPVKYWKVQKLVDKKFMGGFAFNRRHFHTNIDACVSCIYWSNENDTIASFKLDAYDIKVTKLNNTITESLDYEGKIDVIRINEIFSKRYYDKRPMAATTMDGIVVGLDGMERKNKSKALKPLYSNEMAGYIVAHAAGHPRGILQDP
jgi:WD40 repeat protein